MADANPPIMDNQEICCRRPYFDCENMESLEQALRNSIVRTECNMGAINVWESSAYDEIIDEVAPGTTYHGKALPGTLTTEAKWSIKLITVVGGITTIRYAEGSSNCNKVWDDRATYDYEPPYAP